MLKTGTYFQFWQNSHGKPLIHLTNDCAVTKIVIKSGWSCGWPDLWPSQLTAVMGRPYYGCNFKDYLHLFVRSIITSNTKQHVIIVLRIQITPQVLPHKLPSNTLKLPMKNHYSGLEVAVLLDWCCWTLAFPDEKHEVQANLGRLCFQCIPDIWSNNFLKT